MAGPEGGGASEAVPGLRPSGLTIFYATHKLQRTMDSNALLVREYGPDLGRRIALRLKELRALPTLGHGKSLTQLGLHQLSQNRDEQLAVKLLGLKRLVFDVANEPIPRMPDGGLDLWAVTEIEIIEVVDYH